MARILVVDDDDGVAAYLKDMLEISGYQVDRAATADGAVERVKVNHYDLVLMDMLLQGRRRDGDDPSTTQSVNGVVATLALRALGYDGPVVVLTGNLADINKEIEEAAGFAGKLLKPALPSAVLPEVARHLARSTRKKRILIVEDEAALASTEMKILVDAGYEVDVAPSGESALAMLSQKSYAMALVDLKLPDISGLEVVAQARSLGLTLPLVAVSGYDTQGELPGFSAVLSKPLSLTQLLNITEEYTITR